MYKSTGQLRSRTKVLWGGVVLLVVAGIGGCAREMEPDPPAEKPVVYLYPERPTTVTVDLDYAGSLTATYPQAAPAGPEWTVHAQPDGTLTAATGRTYPYLFWEGNGGPAFTQTEGFVVAREDVIPFLEEKLAVLGLTDREAADFITYWAPRLQTNDHSLVTFATDQYANVAHYTFQDQKGQEMTPDTFLRVFLVFSPASADTRVPAQQLPAAPARTGFTVVEWGGSQL